MSAGHTLAKFSHCREALSADAGIVYILALMNRVEALLELGRHRAAAADELTSRRRLALLEQLLRRRWDVFQRPLTVRAVVRHVHVEIEVVTVIHDIMMHQSSRGQAKVSCGSHGS